MSAAAEAILLSQDKIGVQSNPEEILSLARALKGFDPPYHEELFTVGYKDFNSEADLLVFKMSLGDDYQVRII